MLEINTYLKLLFSTGIDPISLEELRVSIKLTASPDYVNLKDEEEGEKDVEEEEEEEK